jgi:hypothetical protein
MSLALDACVDSCANTSRVARLAELFSSMGMGLFFVCVCVVHFLGC